MSRHDPAFLFYPGDASEDTQHMNRLERGAYFDILKAQKRFGKFTFDHIKKICGNDFENVWSALKMCLTHEEDMFFIGWVNDAIENRRAYSESRRNNRKGSKKEDNSIISASQEKDMKNISTTHVEDMGNGNGNGNENTNTVSEVKGVEGEKETTPHGPQIHTGPSVLIVPELKGVWMKHRRNYQFDLHKDAQPLRLIGEAIAKGENVSAYDFEGVNQIKQTFETLVEWSLTHNLFKNYQLSQFERYFQSICDTFRNDNGDALGTTVGGGPKQKGPVSTFQNNLKTSQGAADLIKKKYGQTG